MRVVQIKPPKRVLEKFDKTIFLSGSIDTIDMEKATDWRSELVKYLQSKSSNSVASVGVFNPLRNEWDSSWSQDINNDKFFEQVSWELSHINKCDIAVVYFTKDSKDPITLMELGKLSEIKSSDNIIVFCPEGFYKKGNVDILCYLKGIAVHTKSMSFYEALDKALDIKDQEDVYETIDSSTESQDKELEKGIITFEDSFDISLFENTYTAVSGKENILVVSDYDEVLYENSCIMGIITFKGKKIFAGLCKENDDVKTTLYYKRKGSEKIFSETFKLIRVCDEYPEQCIILLDLKAYTLFLSA